MSHAERCAEVEACKAVTTVIPNAPCFGLTQDFLDRHQIHIVAMGEEYLTKYPNPDDDPYYGYVRKLGICKILPRTNTRTCPRPNSFSAFNLRNWTRILRHKVVDYYYNVVTVAFLYEMFLAWWVNWIFCSLVLLLEGAFMCALFGLPISAAFHRGLKASWQERDRGAGNETTFFLLPVDTINDDRDKSTSFLCMMANQGLSNETLDWLSYCIRCFVVFVLTASFCSETEKDNVGLCRNQKELRRLFRWFVGRLNQRCCCRDRSTGRLEVSV